MQKSYEKGSYLQTLLRYSKSRITVEGNTIGF